MSAYMHTRPVMMNDSAPLMTRHTYARSIARTLHVLMHTPIVHLKPQFRLQHHISVAISHSRKVDAH